MNGDTRPYPLVEVESTDTVSSVSVSIAGASQELHPMDRHLPRLTRHRRRPVSTRAQVRQHVAQIHGLYVSRFPDDLYDFMSEVADSMEEQL
jgi:hypothetical protein